MTSTNNLTPSCEAGIQPVDEVFAWLIEGHRDSDIREAIKEKWPDLDPKQVQLVAVERIRAAAACDDDVIIGFALLAYRDLYKRMVKIGDFAGAAKAVKELVALTSHVQRIRSERNTEEAAGESSAEETEE